MDYRGARAVNHYDEAREIFNNIHHNDHRELWLFPAEAAAARNSHLNDKIQNRPYADLRRWHLGFSIGMHTEDLRFTHNGLITDAGEQWRLEQPTSARILRERGLYRPASLTHTSPCACRRHVLSGAAT